MFPKFVFGGRIFNLNPFFFPNEDLGILSGDGEEKENETPETDTDDNELPDEEDEKENKEDATETSNEDVPDEDEGDEKEEDDKEEKDDKEDNKEEEEVDENLELTSTITDIKKEFPDFFKKFPDVRAAMFREQQYVETVGTLDQAKIAVSHAETLGLINRDLANGEIKDLLGTIKKNDETAFTKIASKLLPTLQALDKDLYIKVAALPIKQLLRSARKEGKGAETDLGKAAAIIHQYFFENTDFNSPVEFEGKDKEDGETPREKALREQIENINRREADTFGNSVDKSYIDRMTSEIRTGLDKDERLSDYAKSKLVEDILRDIKLQLKRDTRFDNTMRSLFKQAREGGFTNDFKSRLVSTALARAKSLIPETRKKLVSQALGKRVKEDKKEDKVERHSTSRRTEVKPNQRTPTKPLSDIDILRAP